MVKVRVNRLNHFGCLVIGVSFKTAINDPLLDLNFMVFMPQYESTHYKFNGTVKAENGKHVINWKAITIFQKLDLTKIKCG